MPRYKLEVEAYVTGTVTVDAPNLDAAVRAANEIEYDIKSMDDLFREVSDLKPSGLLAMKPEVSKARKSYKRVRPAKVRAKRSGDRKELVPSAGRKRGRSRGSSGSNEKGEAN